MIRTNTLIRTVPQSFAFFIHIALPAQTILFLVEASNGNIKRFHICLHYLARSVVRVVKSFLPMLKLFLFNHIAKSGQQVIFHIMFQTNSCSKHVALFGNVADKLVCRALYIFEEKGGLRSGQLRRPVPRGHP